MSDTGEVPLYRTFRFLYHLWQYQPILLIFLSFSSSISLIFLPSIIISFSEAKFESVRMAFDVVMFDRFAKSSRER